MSVAPAVRTLERAGTAACRRLVFPAGRGLYSLPLEAVQGLLEPVALRRVPLAPDFVLGLVERHNAVVTVLDLCRLIGVAEGRGSAAIVRLAPPFEHLALRVEEPVRVAEGLAEDAPEPIDPAALVALAVSAIGSSAR